MTKGQTRPMNENLHKYEELSEDALLKAYLDEGDQLAYGELYRRHVPKVNAALKILLNDAQIWDKEDARKEIIQKTLLNLLESKSFKEGKVENFQVYLYKIMRNTFIAHCKNTKKRTGKKDEYQRLHIIENDIEMDFEEDVEDKRKKVNEAIEKLNSDGQKKVIYHKFWEGFTHEMIAEETGIEKDNVRNYINRAKKKLKKLLG